MNMLELRKSRAEALNKARTIAAKCNGDPRKLEIPDERELARLTIEGRSAEQGIQRLYEAQGGSNVPEFLPWDATPYQWATSAGEIGTTNASVRGGGSFGFSDTANTISGARFIDASTGKMLASAASGESFSASLRAKAEHEGKQWLTGFSADSFGKVLTAKLTGKRAMLNDVELQALSGTVDYQGGYFVPDALSSTIIDLFRPQSVIYRAGAQTVAMETENLTIAKIATDPTFTIVAPNAEIAESSPTFSSVNLYARKLATIVKIDQETAADAANFPPALTEQLTRSLAVEFDRQVLMGTSGSEFSGLNMRSDISAQTGVGSPTYDDFMDSWQTLMEANVPDDNLSYIVCPRDAATLSKLTGSTTQEYLQPPREVAAMRRLVSNNISRTQGGGGNESSAFVLDGRELLIGVRGAPEISTTTEASDAFSKHQLWIKCVWRIDFAVTRPSAIVRLSGITA